MKNKLRWMEEYRCGCSVEVDTKRDLVGYCGTHGDDRVNLYRINDTTAFHVKRTNPR